MKPPPTDEFAGSLGKIEVMAARACMYLPLFVAGDNKRLSERDPRRLGIQSRPPRRPKKMNV